MSDHCEVCGEPLVDTVQLCADCFAIEIQAEDFWQQRDADLARLAADPYRPKVDAR